MFSERVCNTYEITKSPAISLSPGCCQPKAQILLICNSEIYSNQVCGSHTGIDIRILIRTTILVIYPI